MKIIYNNLRKVKSIDVGDLVKVYNLDCGHTITVPKEVENSQEFMACYLCARENNGYMSHYFDYEHLTLSIQESKRTCHLCKEKDFIINLEPSLSSNGIYYYSHEKCISKNNGFATKKDNADNIKNLQMCKFCGLTFKDDVKYELAKYSIEICDDCYSYIELLKVFKFKVFKNDIRNISKLPVYNFCRDGLSKWKSESMMYFKKYNDMDKLSKFDIHHSNYSFSDILYTSMKLLSIDTDYPLAQSEVNQISNLVNLMHYLFVVGVPLNEEWHDELHKANECVDLSTNQVIDIYNKNSLNASSIIECEKIKNKRINILKNIPKK